MQTSIQNVTHLRHKGIVAGEFDRVSRRWWYTKKEVHAALEYLKTSRPMHFGELYGRAFDAYAEGQAPRDVVRALRIPLARALTLLQEFEPGHVVIPPEHVLEMRALLKARGMRAGNSSELVSALERLCKRDALLAHIELEAAD